MESGNIRSCIGRELIPRPHSVEAAKTIILSDECAQKNRCVCSKIFKGGFPPTTMVISARASRARHNHAQHRRPKRRRPQRLPFSLPNLTTLSVLSPPPARPTASPRCSSHTILHCVCVAQSYTNLSCWTLPPAASHSSGAPSDRAVAAFRSSLHLGNHPLRAA